MEIALSGLNQQFGSSVSLDNSSQRQRQDTQQQSSAGSDRAQQNRTVENQSSQNQTRAETSQRTPPSQESSRIINGEVLSSETQRVSSRESTTRLSSRSANQQPSGQPDNRRITAQQAIQNFQQNEDLVPSGNQQRQVSGIIDTFV